MVSAKYALKEKFILPLQIKKREDPKGIKKDTTECLS
tara:strand:- start:52 stop:162 length:111 start_codon:yes stop_codon:yes gene_type:complete